mmetsp:Transcript_23181/g.39616  ORF Transcript_23181/g.39616 Transcript_23181/m.39616 type:complete len:256 (+) Transcript_23181:108-875(+)
MGHSSNSQVCGRRRQQRASSHLTKICASLLLSSSVTAFAPIISTIGKRTLAPRSAVIQRYRVEEDSSNASQSRAISNPYSFLPSRLSSIECLNEPSKFQTHVLDEEDSLVVVRFYSEVCPSCKATRPLFTKWSRDLESNANPSNSIGNGGILGSEEEPLPIKIVEMPLNRANSSFLKNQLRVNQLPYCHLYHPKFGMVEEQVVLNKDAFKEFVNVVDCWSKGGCEADLEHLSNNVDQTDDILFESYEDGDCIEFC